MSVVLDQTCAKCAKRLPLIPLHGEKGGPLMCFMCSGEWHAEHGRRRKWGRIVMKAMRMYMREGGRAKDFEAMKSSMFMQSLGIGHLPGYEPDTIGAEIGDITSELLADTLRLTHPDMHPPERGELAQRVTQELLALKPFTFPAPKAKPQPNPQPRYTSEKVARRTFEKPSQPSFPCEECARTIPYYYCDACRAEWNKRKNEERDRERAKQRKWNERYRARRRRALLPKACAACGSGFQPKRKDTVYCSRACRQTAYRRRSAA